MYITSANTSYGKFGLVNRFQIEVLKGPVHDNALMSLPSHFILSFIHVFFTYRFHKSNTMIPIIQHSSNSNRLGPLLANKRQTCYKTTRRNSSNVRACLCVWSCTHSNWLLNFVLLNRFLKIEPYIYIMTYPPSGSRLVGRAQRSLP